MSVQPYLGINAGAVVEVAPLGKLYADTHKGPLQVQIRIDEVRQDDAREIAADPDILEGIEHDIVSDTENALRKAVTRAVFVVLGGALVLPLVRHFTWQALRRGLLAAIIVYSATLITAVATWTPAKASDPRYSGVLSLAPQLIGNADDIITHFDSYREQLAQLIKNVSNLYEAAGNLPTGPTESNMIRILHISDMHLNPAGFDVAQQISESFQVDAILDTGDITDHGTAIENEIVNFVAKFELPYIWVRGNHDSLETQAAMASLPNVRVLDGNATHIEGLLIYGEGDPTFTPDKRVQLDFKTQEKLKKEFAPELANRLSALPTQPDVLAVHDPAMAQKSGDLAGLILAGHRHKFEESRIGNTPLLVVGSTGGAGLRILDGEAETPIQASVLYFDKDTKKLQAYDLITVSSLEEQNVTIQRHIMTIGPAAEGDTPPLDEETVPLDEETVHSDLPGTEDGSSDNGPNASHLPNPQESGNQPAQTIKLPDERKNLSKPKETSTPDIPARAREGNSDLRPR